MKNVETVIKSFEVKDELSSEIWSNPTDEPMNEVNASSLKLRPEIRERLLKIAELFIDYLKVDIFIEDIRMTGSLANYNWSEYSDIDLHILADFSQFPEEQLPLYEDLFRLKKTIFNERSLRSYQLVVKNFPYRLRLLPASEF